MSRRHHASHEFELNLTPIIDCFVTLICFLLLSTTYVNLVSLDAKVPISVPTTAAQAEKDDKPKFKLELNVKKTGMELMITGAGDLSGKRTIALKDYKTLHAELVKVKHQKSKEFSIHFTSEIDMPYEELVRYMDTTRNLEPSDGIFTITDERNGQTVKVDTLFPDFVMANLGEKEVIK
jgi:biopolymer transport protein ExbD